MTAQTGVLLVNLGTPNAPTPAAVKDYLKEFLSDPQVVSIWPPLWKLLLNVIILPIRSKKSAALYKKIWLPTGSPLLVNSQQQAIALQQQLDQKNISTKVVLAMRYGKPNIQEGLAELKNLGVQKIIVLPLYPQYSTTTTASSINQVNLALANWPDKPEIKFIASFYDNADYIAALSEKIGAYWQQHGKGEKLLFSFHGLPQKLIALGDPYAKQCQLTVKALVTKLGLQANDYELVYQSRFGAQKWLQPCCVQSLQHLAQTGCKRVDVVCPGFTVDCLETLEEIAVTNAEIFKNAGGSELHYIPALNADAKFIQALANLINANINSKNSSI